LSNLFKKPYVPPKKIVKYYSLKEIEAIVQNKDAPKKELKRIIDALVEYHHIPPKEQKEHIKKAKKLLDMIFTLSGHTNIDDDLRQDMFDRLIRTNPDYKSDFIRGR